MEIYTLDVYKTTESLVIKGFSANQNLLRHNLGFQNCIKDGKNIDPAMGSGHILVYAFDLLYEIYLAAGYSEREIPSLILERNLYGLDIDDRAGQLASFALLMKARSKNRRIFRNKPQMNLCSIQESNDIPKEAIEYLCFLQVLFA